jgi:hypothetical protein
MTDRIAEAVAKMVRADPLFAGNILIGEATVSAGREDLPYVRGQVTRIARAVVAPYREALAEIAKRQCQTPDEWDSRNCAESSDNREYDCPPCIARRAMEEAACTGDGGSRESAPASTSASVSPSSSSASAATPADLGACGACVGTGFDRVYGRQKFTCRTCKGTGRAPASEGAKCPHGCNEYSAAFECPEHGLAAYIKAHPPAPPPPAREADVHEHDIVYRIEYLDAENVRLHKWCWTCHRYVGPGTPPPQGGRDSPAGQAGATEEACDAPTEYSTSSAGLPSASSSPLAGSSTAPDSPAPPGGERDKEERACFPHA